MKFTGSVTHSILITSDIKCVCMSTLLVTVWCLMGFDCDMANQSIKFGTVAPKDVVSDLRRGATMNSPRTPLYNT